MDIGQVIGFIAAGLSCVAALPHLMKSWKDGTQGVSSAAWILAAVNSTLWVTFAVMTHTYATLVSSVANGLIAGAILFLVFNEKRLNQMVEEQVAEAEPVLAPIPHRTPVAVKMRRLDERDANLDQTFTELTQTLELSREQAVSRQLEPVTA